MTISIAGWLEARHLQVLESQCTAVAAKVTLDLTELRGTDEEAVRWLSSWVTRGARVVGESPYIRLLLERATETSDR